MPVPIPYEPTTRRASRSARTTTFLEFVIEAVLGEPNHVIGNGESCWTCPHCGSSKFHTRPSKPGEKDRWSCWSCGKWGDEFDLLTWAFPGDDYSVRQRRLDMLRLEFDASSPEEKVSAAARLTRLSESIAARHADQEGASSSGEDWESTAHWPQLVATIDDAAVSWLRQRGLTVATIRAAKLGSCGGDVLIPWHNSDGSIRAINIRRLDGRDPKYMLTKGSRKGIVYPRYVSDSSRPVLICEGELDCLLARQELGDGAQCITPGSVADRLPADVMADLAARAVYCAFDGDAAGDQGFERLRASLPHARRVRPPDGCDLTDLHVAVGLASWFDMLMGNLANAQVCILQTLTKARGPCQRSDLAEQVFGDARRNLRPILEPLVEGGLVRRYNLDAPGERTEVVHAITLVGRDALAKAVATDGPLR
jgi:hypothetical protein